MEEEGAVETKLCSNCKRDINAATFVLHQAHCLRHITLCERCGEPVPTTEMESHFEDNHTLTKCSECGEEVAKDGMEEHKDQFCPERMIECKYCELSKPLREFDEHVEACGSRTDYCDRCNQRVMLKEMEEHRELKCGRGESPPPIASDPADLANMSGYSEPPLPHLQSNGLPPLFADLHSSGVVLPMFNSLGFVNNLGSAPGPPPVYPGVNEEGEEVEVDPQWLEMAREACGEEEVEHMLAMYRAGRGEGFAGHPLQQPWVEEVEMQQEETDPQFHGGDVLDPQFHGGDVLDPQFHGGDVLDPQFHGGDVLDPQLQGGDVLDPQFHGGDVLDPQFHGGDVLDPQLQEGDVLDPQLSDQALAQRLQRKYDRQLQEEQRDADIAHRLQEQFGGNEEIPVYGYQGNPPPPPPPDTGRQPSLEDDEELARKLQEQEHHKYEGHTAPPPAPPPSSPTPQHSLDDDAKLAQRLQEEEELKYNRRRERNRSHRSTEEELQSSLHLPRPPNDYQSYGPTSAYSSLSLPYHGDTEHPRPKTPPLSSNSGDKKEEAGEEGKVPCQFCHKLFPFEKIMSHQQQCSLEPCPNCGRIHPRKPVLSGSVYAYGRSYSSSASRTYGSGYRDRYAHSYQDQQQQQQQQEEGVHSLADEGVMDRGRGRREEGGRMGVTQARQRVAPTYVPPLTEGSESSDEDGQGDEHSCIYCGSCYPASCIHAHQILCDFNPDKKLKTAYLQQSSVSSSSPGQWRETEKKTLQQGMGENPIIPCEFCGESIVINELENHQVTCMVKQATKPGGTPVLPSQSSSQSTRDGASEGDSLEVGPCEHCGESIPLRRLVKHQISCQLKRPTHVSRKHGTGVPLPRQPYDARTPRTVQPTLTCEHCGKGIPLDQLETHKISCQLSQPSEEPASPSSSSLPFTPQQTKLLTPHVPFKETSSSSKDQKFTPAPPTSKVTPAFWDPPAPKITPGPSSFKITPGPSFTKIAPAPSVPTTATSTCFTPPGLSKFSPAQSSAFTPVPPPTTTPPSVNRPHFWPPPPSSSSTSQYSPEVASPYLTSQPDTSSPLASGSKPSSADMGDHTPNSGHLIARSMDTVSWSDPSGISYQMRGLRVEEDSAPPVRNSAQQSPGAYTPRGGRLSDSPSKKSSRSTKPTIGHSSVSTTKASLAAGSRPKGRGRGANSVKSDPPGAQMPRKSSSSSYRQSDRAAPVSQRSSRRPNGTSGSPSVTSTRAY